MLDGGNNGELMVWLDWKEAQTGSLGSEDKKAVEGNSAVAFPFLSLFLLVSWTPSAYPLSESRLSWWLFGVFFESWLRIGMGIGMGIGIEWDGMGIGRRKQAWKEQAWKEQARKEQVGKVKVGKSKPGNVNWEAGT